MVQAAISLLFLPAIGRALRFSAEGVSPIQVCLSTTPWRIGAIKPVVDSFLEQDYHTPKSIVVTVPKELHRGNAVASLKDSDLAWTKDAKYEGLLKVNVIDSKDDKGPATKLLGCLPFVAKNENSLLLVSDDDAPRKPDYARKFLTNCSGEQKRDVLGAVFPHRGNDPSLHVQGNRGFSVCRDLINDDAILERFEAVRDKCFFVDDQFFSKFFKETNLQMRVLKMSDGELLLGGKFLFDGDSSKHGLKELGGSGKQKVHTCYKAMR